MRILMQLFTDLKQQNLQIEKKGFFLMDVVRIVFIGNVFD